MLKYLLTWGFLGWAWLCAGAEIGVEAWVQRYGEINGASEDHPNKIVVDPNGDVIIAGYSDDSAPGTHGLLIKYSSNGVPVWTNRFNGGAGTYTEANDIAVDSAGNIYVAGDSFQNNGFPDYIVIKYSPGGVPIWTNYYDGPGHNEDRATSICVDHAGHVYVTGYSYGSGSGYDYATIAYSDTGLPLWTNRFNGAANLDDKATMCGADGAGNVFVTGTAFGTNAPNHTTIKYSSLGISVWTNSYRAGTSDLEGGMVVDASGNVYVTGTSFNSDTIDWDYGTVAYSSSGQPVWTNYYHGPARGSHYPVGIVIAGGSNICVAGHASGGSFEDFATIAYSMAGVALWTNRYNDGIYGAHGAAIAADLGGNIYVAGSTDTTGTTSHRYTTVCYSGSGLLLWTNVYAGGTLDDQATAIGVDGAGNVFITGESKGHRGGDYDCATIAYSGNGTALWTNRYDAPGGSSEQAAAVAMDPSGNIYVTGFSSSAFNQCDFITIKYSSSGLPAWTNYYWSPGSILGRPTAMCVASNGNVYVTGYSGYPGFVDYVTLAYSNQGVPLWTNRYDGPRSPLENSLDQAEALGIDAGGNVYVTGFSTGVDGYPYYDYATLKYSSSGVPLWTNRYSSPGDNSDIAFALAVDSNGDVIVTGNSYGSSGNPDFVTIKYSSSGVGLWTNRYNGPGNGNDNGTAIAVDKNANVVVTGSSRGANGVSDFVTIKYSATGAGVWTNRYVGPATNTSIANAVTVDTNGDVYVSGYSAGVGTGFDYATVKYSSAGTAVWTNRYSAPGNSDDEATAIGIDNAGNIYVTGFSAGTNSYDYTTIKYTPAGIALWTNRYNGPANGNDKPGRFCLAAGQGVCVAGASDGAYGTDVFYDFAVVKYVSVTQPWLTISNAPAGSNFKFLINGSPNQTVRVDMTTNLVAPIQWSVLATVTNQTGMVPFVDLGSTNSARRFYRAAVIP